MAAEWRSLWDELGVQGDEFIRTTDLKHAHTVHWLFRHCRENGFVYPGHYTGQYCIYDNAYVDVKPGENCPDCGRPTETVTEANYFFKLSAFQKPLLDWYANILISFSPKRAATKFSVSSKAASAISASPA